MCSGKGFPSALVSAEHSSSAGLAEAAWVLSSDHSGRIGLGTDRANALGAVRSMNKKEEGG